MARNATVVATSDKTFGGSVVPAGNYIIESARIVKNTLTIAGQEERTYDSLELTFKTEQGLPVHGTLSLNGCWRPRRGEDGKAYQASGSFFTQVLTACTGKSFAETRDFINQTFANKKVSVNFNDYPSLSGSFGHVPVVEVLA